MARDSDEEDQDGRSYKESMAEYENEKQFQKERMRRRIKMKEIENLKYVKMDMIRSSIEEINRNREVRQIIKNDTTPVLEPVFQSVQSLIGKQKASEVKTFNGREIVRLDTKLIDIPLIEEEVQQTKEYQEMLNAKAELLQPGMIAQELQILDAKILKSQVRTTPLPGEGNSQVKELFRPPSSNKRKTIKQLSIIQRMQLKEKAHIKEESEKALLNDKQSLLIKQKQILNEFEMKAREQKRQAEELQLRSSVSGNNAAPFSPSHFLKQSGNPAVQSPHSPKRIPQRSAFQFSEQQPNATPRSQSKHQSQSVLGFLTEPTNNNNNAESLSKNKILDGQENPHKLGRSPSQRHQLEQSSPRKEIKKNFSIQLDVLEAETYGKESYQTNGNNNNSNTNETKTNRNISSFRITAQQQVGAGQQQQLRQAQSILVDSQRFREEETSSPTRTRRQIKQEEDPKKNFTVVLDHQMQEHLQNMKIRSNRLHQVKMKLGLMDNQVSKLEEWKVIKKDLDVLEKERKQELSQPPPPKFNPANYPALARKSQKQSALKQQTTLNSQQIIDMSQQMPKVQAQERQLLQHQHSLFQIPQGARLQHSNSKLQPSSRRLQKLNQQIGNAFSASQSIGYLHESSVEKEKTQQDVVLTPSIRESPSSSLHVGANSHQNQNKSLKLFENQKENAKSLRERPVQQSNSHGITSSQCSISQDYEGPNIPDTKKNLGTKNSIPENYHLKQKNSTLTAHANRSQQGTKAGSDYWNHSRNGTSLNAQGQSNQSNNNHFRVNTVSNKLDTLLTAQHNRRNNREISAKTQITNDSVQPKHVLSQSQSSQYFFKENLRNFFKSKVELKKDFGERINDADKTTFDCKKKVNSFFGNVLEYQDASAADSSKVRQQLKTSFNSISHEFERWQDKFLDKNENFEKIMAQDVLAAFKTSSLLM